MLQPRANVVAGSNNRSVADRISNICRCLSNATRGRVLRRSTAIETLALARTKELPVNKRN